jgi:lantibiotic modifying enzyme
MAEHQPLSRRDMLRGALGAASLLALPRNAWTQSLEERAARARMRFGADLDVALRAERWIRAARIPTAKGVTWPADPRDAKTVSADLYNGMPGVVLFLLELHHATGERTFLDEARAGADEILAGLSGPFDGGGLYTGAAGHGFVLGETWRATDDVKYREGARRAVTLLRENAKPAGSGVAWSDSADIISGSAGIALFLLYAAKTLGADEATELALRAGRRLVELGQPAEGGLKWGISPSVPQLYPNFSHGAAGVSYALATVYGATREKSLLDAALAGAEYLEAVADHANGACKVFHHEPGGSDLFYLSWCHGGPGTARLFYRLSDVTGDRAWLERIDCYARGITAMGAPVKRSPGYWENISQCCGNAGVGEFFLSLHRLWPDRGYLEVARQAAGDILARATEEHGGLRWVQSEHRVRPELLIAQTGRMQGAAGVGTFFLHLEAQASGRPPRLIMPDSPYA